MKAASDDGRLLKKVAPRHRQPLTSKPRSPDWTRDVWLLIFAFSLFVFCSSLYRFLPLRFSLLLSAIHPTAPLPLHSPPSLFLSVNLPSHHSLIKLFHPPSRSSLSDIPLTPHHQDTITLHLFRPSSLGPSALLFSAFSQTQLGSETSGMRVLVKLVERKTWGLVVGRWHRGLRISSGAMLVLV